MWYGSGDSAYGGLAAPETYSNLKDALNELVIFLLNNRLAYRASDWYYDDPYPHITPFSGQNYLTYLDEFFYEGSASIWHNKLLEEEFKAITDEIFSATTVTESGLSLSIPIPDSITEDLVNLERKIRRTDFRQSSDVVKLLTVWMRDEDENYPHGDYYEIWYLGGSSK